MSREQVDVGVMEVHTTTSVSSKREQSPSHQMRLVWSSEKGDDPAKKRCKTKVIDTVAGEESVCGPVGLGHSSIPARNARKSAEAGTFVINAWKLENWKNKILILNHYAEFYPQDVCHVRHSKCGTDIKVKEPYDTTRFAQHKSMCQGSVKKSCAAGGSSTLTEMAKRFGWSEKGHVEIRKMLHTPLPEPKPLVMPCPGLCDEDDNRISTYLRRSSVSGAGSRSLATISREMFSREFKDLKETEKTAMLHKQMHERKWTNDHVMLRVFSTECTHTASGTTTGQDSRPMPCNHCQALLHSKALKTTLHKPTPNDKDFIYVNHRYRNKVLGEAYGRVIGLKDLIENSVSH